MRTAVVVAVLTASAFMGPAAWAELHTHALDQYTGFPSTTEATPDFGYAVAGTTMMAQTFTVGLEGTLCHVQIGNTTGAYYGNPYLLPGRPVVEIWSTTTGGQPWSITNGASVTLDNPVPESGWTPFIDFTPYNIWVEPDQIYAIVLYEYNSTGPVSVGAMKTDGYYDRGALWTTASGSWSMLSDVGPGRTPIYDMQFRTYVVPVPLPAGVWLGIFAVGVAGWHLKRRTT